MKYYAQIFNDEIIYAAVYGIHKNNNYKAVIISSIYKKAKHTSIQNISLWMKIDEENIPVLLMEKIFNKITK
jgi:ribosomal protein L25 (general stress protein Ctc)